MTYETKNNGTIEMDKKTFTRWLCLMEAFYIIDKKAEDLGINLGDEDIVKPLAFEKYVQQRFESMLLDVDHDHRNNLLGKNIVTSKNESPNLVISPVS
jgi:hypothetical protein